MKRHDFCSPENCSPSVQKVVDCIETILIKTEQHFTMEPTKAPQEMIKEYHFHTYWFLNDPVTESIAVDLFNQISLSNFGKPLRVNRSPVGPHPIGSFETWVPIEYFGEAYSFFTLNRKGLSVLLHPLTREEVKDHTERAMWMGAPMPLKVDQLTPLLDHVPAQYPELGLGNSKKA